MATKIWGTNGAEVCFEASSRCTEKNDGLKEAIWKGGVDFFYYLLIYIGEIA